MELEPNDDRVWRGGLARLAVEQATVTVTIEGYESRVIGQLVQMTTDGGIVLEQPDTSDPASGSAMWVPRERIISVATRYHRASEPHDVRDHL